MLLRKALSFRLRNIDECVLYFPLLPLGHGFVAETHLGRMTITDSHSLGNSGDGMRTKFLDGRYPIFDERETFCRRSNIRGGFPLMISGIPSLSPPCENVSYTTQITFTGTQLCVSNAEFRYKSWLLLLTILLTKFWLQNWKTHIDDSL